MDQYVKAEILGRGTFGEVIKATHKEVRRGSCGRLPPPPAGRRLCQLVRAPQSRLKVHVIHCHGGTLSRYIARRWLSRCIRSTTLVSVCSAGQGELAVSIFAK